MGGLKGTASHMVASVNLTLVGMGAEAAAAAGQAVSAAQAAG